jgi:hypothetical protein
MLARPVFVSARPQTVEQEPAAIAKNGLTNNGAPLARHLLGHGVLASIKLSQSLLKTIFLGRYFARQD